MILQSTRLERTIANASFHAIKLPNDEGGAKSNPWLHLIIPMFPISCIYDLPNHSCSLLSISQVLPCCHAYMLSSGTQCKCSSAAKASLESYTNVCGSKITHPTICPAVEPSSTRSLSAGCPSIPSVLASSTFSPTTLNPKTDFPSCLCLDHTLWLGPEFDVCITRDVEVLDWQRVWRRQSAIMHLHCIFWELCCLHWWLRKSKKQVINCLLVL